MNTHVFSQEKTSAGATSAAFGRRDAGGKNNLPTHDQVAARARDIWLAKGCPAGKDEENWREAETQLKAEAQISRFSGKSWIGLHEEDDGKVLLIHASGKLTREDYEGFVPEMERLIRRHGQINVLFEMHDFHGWQVGAFWEDTKFAMRHFRDVKRVALVGETGWQKTMTLFCKPFTMAELMYFEHGDLAQAQQWVRAGTKVH